MGVGTFGGNVKSFEASLADGRLAGAARIATLETKDENLHTHLMAPDFFDAERNPDVSASRPPASSGEGSELAALEGEITIKGVSRPATLAGTIVGPVTDPYGNTRYGLQLQTVDRPHGQLESPGTPTCRTAPRRSQTSSR